MSRPATRAALQGLCRLGFVGALLVGTAGLVQAQTSSGGESWAEPAALDGAWQPSLPETVMEPALLPADADALAYAELDRQLKTRGLAWGSPVLSRPGRTDSSGDLGLAIQPRLRPAPRVQLLVEATNLAPVLNTPQSLQDQVARLDDSHSPRDVLQMRTARSSFAGIRGALKFAVSSQSYLIVKPRRHRVSVEFRSSW